MAQDEERIKITFDTNADDAKKSTDSLNSSIERTIDKSDEVVDANKKLGKSQKSVSNSTKEQKASLEDLGGGFGSAVQGAKALGKQFLALMANPIILALAAIVATVTLLFKAFTSTKEGGEKLDRVMAGISAVIDVLRDRFLKIIDVAKKLFTGDVIGAAKDYFAIFKGAGDEIAEEFNKAANAVRSLQEVADATRDLSVARAKLNRDLAESEKILQDENATYEQKKKALADVQRLEGEQTRQELENAKKRLKAIQEQNALSDSNAEALQAEADAKIALFALEQKSAEDRRKIQDFNRTIDGQESARKKAIADEQRAQYLERKKQREEELKQIQDFNNAIASKEEALLKQLQDLQDESAQEKLDRQRERDLQEIELLKQKGADVTTMLELNAQIYAEKQLEIDEAEREAKRIKQEQDLADELEFRAKEADARAQADQVLLDQQQRNKDDILSTGSALLEGSKMLGEKNKGLQKAAIITEGAVSLGKVGANIATGISKDASSGAIASIPQIIKTVATGVIATAGIITNTKRALQALGGGGSVGTAPTLPSVRGASAQPQTGFQASNENQIATSITNAQTEQPPIKAYVVTSDVTTGQNLDAKIIEENSF